MDLLPTERQAIERWINSVGIGKNTVCPAMEYMRNMSKSKICGFKICGFNLRICSKMTKHPNPVSFITYKVDGGSWLHSGEKKTYMITSCNKCPCSMFTVDKVEEMAQHLLDHTGTVVVKPKTKGEEK